MKDRFTCKKPKSHHDNETIHENAKLLTAKISTSNIQYSFLNIYIYIIVIYLYIKIYN